MKKILAFALAGAAACAAFAAPKAPSKAEIAKQDKANWGGVDYSGASDGENSVANDYAQIRSMARGEAAQMEQLYELLGKMVEANGVLDVAPETYLAETLAQLHRPIDPTPTRELLNIHATPAQKLGFKSLLGMKNALRKFEEGPRRERAALLKTEIECRFCYDYNRLARVTTQGIIKDGSLVESFRKIDAAWGRYLKVLEKVANGTDKWKYAPRDLLDASAKKRLFAEILKETGLDGAFDADGRVTAKTSRSLHLVDNYFKRASDAEIGKFQKSLAACLAAHETAITAHDDYLKWYTENAMSLDPAARAIIKELFDAYKKHHGRDTTMIYNAQDVVADLNNESLAVYKLRKCKGFSPNKAFFVRSGEVSDRPPAYVRRMNELALEMKARFEAAVKKRLDSAGRIQI